MNNLTNKKIAIVGGGPAGLTLARLLQLHDADVTVYERDRNRFARKQGATLDLHEASGLKALRQCGLMEAFMTNYRPGAEKMRITDGDATILLDEHSLTNNRNLRPEIDRGPLQNILLDSLNEGTLVWDSRLLAMNKEGDGWNLEFENGNTTTADLVIAADGANSGIRKYITAVQPYYVGIQVVEGTVYNAYQKCPNISTLLKGGKVFAMSDGKMLIVSSKGNSDLVFYTSFKAGAAWVKDSGIDFSDKKQVTDWFSSEYAGWSAIWQELFEHAETPFITRPQYCMPVGQYWASQPNLTMIGDAAHLIPPFAGEGVNMAMLDALELAEHLTSVEFPGIGDAITAFEQQMHMRSAATAKDTLIATEALHTRDAIKFMLGEIGYTDKK